MRKRNLLIASVLAGLFLAASLALPQIRQPAVTATGDADRHSQPPQHGPAQAVLDPSAVVVRFAPPTSTLAAGGTSSVTVLAQGVVNLGAFEFGIHYSPTVVHVDAISLGDFAASSHRTWTPLGPEIDNGAGVAWFGGYSFGDEPGLTGTVELATIAISAQKAGESALHLEDVQIIDVQAVTQTVTTEDGLAQAGPPEFHVTFDRRPETLIGQGTVCFTDTSTTNGAGIVDRRWRFGDDAVGSGDTTSHTYTSAGSYTVTLVVTDALGYDAQGSLLDAVIVYEPVVADFSASPTAGAAPLLVDFTNLSTGDFHACSWTFGDGSTSDDCGAPSHEYVSVGAYTVGLTVSGPGGADTTSKPAYVSVETNNIYLPHVVRNG
jgi:hypothetical protein